MKNLKTILLVCFLASIFSIQKTFSQAYEQGQLTVSPGIMFGGLGIYNSGAGIPVVASAEYGVSDMLGVGPFIGYASYGYGVPGFRYRWTFSSVGVRVDFHYWELLEETLETDLNSEQFDLYVAALAGYRFARYTTSDGVTVGGNTFSYGDGAAIAITVGGRYYFNPKIAVFLEAGRALFGLTNVGVTIKLK
ncbi:MAG: hypothetical protein R3D00_18490 [Bacteroidia bacterium]